MTPASAAPMEVLIACEDRTHRFLAKRLFDATLEARLTRPPGPSERTFRGVDPDKDWYELKHVKEDARHIRLTGRKRGQLRSAESLAFTRMAALAVVAKAKALIILRDSDNDRDISKDAAEINDDLRNGQLAVAIGVPHRDAEGWLLAGYTPQNKQQGERLVQATRDLHFDPRVEPHRLTAQPNDAATDAKRVVAFILGDGDGLNGKNRAPTRPPTDDELTAMSAGLASLTILATHKEAGATAFVKELRSLVDKLLQASAA